MFQVFLSNTNSFICFSYLVIKYCYLTLIILFNITHSLNVLLCITDYSIRQSFAYTKCAISNNSILFKSFVFTQFKFQTVLWPIEKTLSGATTPGQSGPGRNYHVDVLHISQCSRTGTSPSDGIVSHAGHSLGRILTPKQRCSRCNLQL